MHERTFSQRERGWYLFRVVNVQWFSGVCHAQPKPLFNQSKLVRFPFEISLSKTQRSRRMVIHAYLKITETEEERRPAPPPPSPPPPPSHKLTTTSSSLILRKHVHLYALVFKSAVPFPPVTHFFPPLIPRSMRGDTQMRKSTTRVLYKPPSGHDSMHGPPYASNKQHAQPRILLLVSPRPRCADAAASFPEHVPPHSRQASM